ncbi:MAG: mannose-1-phosphate guanylyltransferase [Candidatus Sumerlaeia bacterium]
MSESKVPQKICVIMAGGSGERFWPLSRQLRPKQLLKLTRADMNLLEETVERIAPLIPPERTYIATSEHLQDPIRKGGAGVPDENVLAEPAKRNTAGCLSWVAAHLVGMYGKGAEDIVMAVLTADHLIPDEENFRSTVAAAVDVAAKQDTIGVIGIKPTRAETGYGYIETPEGASPIAESEEGIATWPVKQFLEKPDQDRANEFVQSDRFMWNSGMFFWKVGAFLHEMGKASPAHAEATREMGQALARGDRPEAARIFESLDDISIDYALMEKATHVVVTRAVFEWDDIGAWDAMDRTRPSDGEGNVIEGDPVLIDSKNCIVYNEPGAEKMAVAVVGLDNIAVIVSEDGILVMPKDRAQDVKKAVQKLKDRKAKQL